MMTLFDSKITEKNRQVAVEMLQCLIIKVTSSVTSEECIHPLLFAMERCSTSDLLYHLVGDPCLSEDSPLLNSAPKSITKLLSFNDEMRQAELRRECGVPENAEFDLPGYYMYNIGSSKQNFSRYRPEDNTFIKLNAYCLRVGPSTSAVNPVVAFIYGFLKDEDGDRENLQCWPLIFAMDYSPSNMKFLSN
jgi:hypothetical protein